MFTLPRRTATRIRDGRPLRKNNWRATPSFPARCGAMPALVVERPGRDARHLVRPAHLRAFLPLVPGWEALRSQLAAIVLTAESWSVDGWYDGDTIRLCAWPRETAVRWRRAHADEHASILGRLGVRLEPIRDHVRCHFTDGQARAFSLVHVLVHELGHHLDRLSTRSQRCSARGEAFAESFAREHEEVLLRRWAAIDPGALGEVAL